MKCQQSKNEKQIWAMYWYLFQYFSSYVNHLRLYQVHTYSKFKVKFSFCKYSTYLKILSTFFMIIYRYLWINCMPNGEFHKDNIRSRRKNLYQSQWYWLYDLFVPSFSGTQLIYECCHICLERYIPTYFLIPVKWSTL